MKASLNDPVLVFTMKQFIASYEHEAQRYIILQNKASGRFLVLYKKDGDIARETVEDVRCAFVFDTDNMGICKIMGEFPDTEWERIELFSMQRGSKSPAVLLYKAS